MWNIRKIVSKGDYNYALVPDHPNSTKNGYVLEHRVVVENNLGRLLNNDEIVHHLNEDKKDNRIENLEVMSSEKHAGLHSAKGLKMVKMKCPNCGTLFDIARHRSFLVKKDKDYNSCSRRCGRLLFMKLSDLGRTYEVQEAISGNIVCEYNSHDNPEETVLQQDP